LLARLGVLEANKSRYPLYRLILMYFFWMAKLSPQVQFGIVIGGWLGNQFLQGLRERHPEWSLWITPFIWLYVAFALMTWTARPLSNLLLRLNRFGRMVLSDEEKREANYIGLCVLGMLASLVLWMIVGDYCWMGIIVFATMMIPIAGTFSLRQDPSTNNCLGLEPSWGEIISPEVESPQGPR
jgi:hypothetical protein